MAKKNEKASDEKPETRGRVPDSHVLSAANEFYEAATILKNAIPNSPPQPLRVMAVFSIELYLKALNSQVVEHQITIDKPGADEPVEPDPVEPDPVEPDPDEPDPKKPDAKNRRFEVTVLTSKPLKFGHKLDELFAELDQREKDTLLSEFARQSFDFGGSSLGEMLERYSNSFVTERYYFELCGDIKNPWQEIMQFAAFFNTTVNAINNRQL